MSGGRFQYFDSTLKSIMFEYDYDGKRHSNPMEDAELSHLVYEMLDLIHELDWFLSGDTEEENYLKAKDAFKKKWLRNKNYKKEVLQKLIEQEFEDKKQELLKML